MYTPDFFYESQNHEMPMLIYVNSFVSPQSNPQLVRSGAAAE